MTVEDYISHDVIIYNMCFADDFELERVNRIISHHRLWRATVLLHCSMHSFQATSSIIRYQLEACCSGMDWREVYPNIEFPYWWKYKGLIPYLCWLRAQSRPS